MLVVRVPFDGCCSKNGLQRSSPSKNTFWNANAYLPEVPAPVASAGSNQSKCVIELIEIIILDVAVGMAVYTPWAILHGATVSAVPQSSSVGTFTFVPFPPQGARPIDVRNVESCWEASVVPPPPIE